MRFGISDKRRQSLTWATLGVFAAVATVLSLSDRVPRLVPRFTALVMRAGRRFERTADIDFFDVSSIPGRTDQIGHTLLWGTGMLAIGWLTRKRIPVTATACLLFAASIAFEVGQLRWTMTRQLEAGDVWANGIGIALAAVAIVVLGAVVDTVARMLRWLLPAVAA